MTLLFDSATRGTLILALAWIATICLRRASADLRHRVWAAAIASVLALPALLWLTPETLADSSLLSSFSVTANVDRAPALAREAPTALYAVWAVGFVLILARLAFGLYRIARVTGSARLVDGVLYSESIMTPLTWGLWRPKIILPDYGMGWNDQQRALVIRHERAHIQRHDWAWQMLAHVATALLWFHPLVWLAAFELKREAENAADDMVLANGVSPSEYAQQIVNVARRLTCPPSCAAVGMVTKSQIEKRVVRILDSGRARTVANAPARWVLFITSAAMLFPLTAMARHHVFKIGEEGTTAPKVIQKQEPVYTAQARAAKLEGAVTLKLEVDLQGQAQHIRVVKSLDPGLDRSAVNAIRHWRFEPGRKDDKPVRTAATIQVNFRLL